MNNPYVKTLEPVWLDTDYVRVNEEKLRELIRGIKQKKDNGELGIPAWDIPNVQPPLDCKLTEWLDFVCTVSSVNFSFTNFEPPHNKFVVEYPEGVYWQGAFALGASFMRAQKEDIQIFDAWHLSEISLEELNHVFRPMDSMHRMPLIEKRLQIFHEVGRMLIKKYDGSWLNLFERGDWRAFNNGKGIVEQLASNFPSFRDVRNYNGRVLKFHKRAQLLVMMHYGRAFNSGWRFPIIDDIEDIGPIADYEVPKALKFLGVLKYASELDAAIKNHQVILPGNPREIENRLSMSYVMKRICDEAGINMAQADYYIWNIGRKSQEPHILVPTTDY